MHRKFISLLISLSFTLPISTSFAAPQFSDCLLVNPTPSTLSLALPLAPERLGNKSKVVIGVIPFSFSDADQSKNRKLVPSDYRSAALNLEALSQKNVQVDLKIFPSIKTKILSKDFGASSSDFFEDVKKLVIDADPVVDFSNLDTVILQNVSTGVNAKEAAMAYQLSRNPGSNSYSSLQTQEGFIDNAILLGGAFHSGVIAHEILHNFGLVDLYPSESGINDFSSMALAVRGQPLRILNYEKAVLGWFPIGNIQCSSFQDFTTRPIAENEIVFEDITQDQLFVLKLNEYDAYVVETQNSNLIVYSIQNKKYPPVSMVSRNVFGIQSQLLSLSSIYSISESFVSTDFTLVYMSKFNNRVTLNIVPTNKVGTMEFESLIQKSAKHKAEAIATINTRKTIKVTKILCTKGEKTKTVKGKNPKCPKGFAKRIRP
jgi:hypothetical protein